MFVAVPYRWLVVVVFAAVIFLLSTTPARSQAGDSIFKWLVISTPTLLQKSLHVGMYAILTFLLVWAMDVAWSRSIRCLAAVALAIALGLALEWAQTRIPGRFGTLLDALLDASGAVIGAIFALLLL